MLVTEPVRPLGEVLAEIAARGWQDADRALVAWGVFQVCKLGCKGLVLIFLEIFNLIIQLFVFVFVLFLAYFFVCSLFCLFYFICLFVLSRLQKHCRFFRATAEFDTELLISGVFYCFF